MNQAIIINDDMTWNKNAERVEFSAMCAGAIVTCQLSSQYLIKKGLEIETNPDEILKYCESIAFDIEEDTQQAIDNEEHIDQTLLILT